jgi:hypothetical protein
MPAAPEQILELDPDEIRSQQRLARDEWKRFSTKLNRSSLEAIEPHARRAEAHAVAALNYLEDHPLRESVHQLVHRAGSIRGGLFGCAIIAEKGKFWTNCPVRVSHLRIGVSAGLTSTFECSICGEVIEDCDHVAGHVYDKTASRIGDDMKCSICDLINCEHKVGTGYPVTAQAIARDMVGYEVSFVPRPRYPQARIYQFTVDDEMPAEYTDLANAGKITCDVCVGPCRGLHESKLWDLHAL